MCIGEYWGIYGISLVLVGLSKKQEGFGIFVYIFHKASEM